MSENPPPQTQPELDLDQIIEIRDPEIDVEAIMARIRENVARRQAQGAYQEDVDAIAQEVFVEVVSPPELAEIATGEGLEPILAQLNKAWMIHEQPFVSHVPVVGPLIVAVRNFWNWMSTKWYVGAVIQQQSNFNALTVQAVREIRAEYQALAQEADRLRELSDEQQKEIRLLVDEIERLQAMKRAEDGTNHGSTL
jgi:O-antigen chain-terminating methyltransferase